MAITASSCGNRSRPIKRTVAPGPSCCVLRAPRSRNNGAKLGRNVGKCRKTHGKKKHLVFQARKNLEIPRKMDFHWIFSWKFPPVSMEWFKGHSWETLWFPLDVPTNPLQNGKPLRKKSGTHVGNYFYKTWTHVDMLGKLPQVVVI